MFKFESHRLSGVRRATYVGSDVESAVGTEVVGGGVGVTGVGHMDFADDGFLVFLVF